MSCETIREWLLLYPDGQLAPEELKATREHLELCKSCRAALAHWQEIKASMQRAPVPPVPGNLRARIQRELEPPVLRSAGRPRDVLRIVRTAALLAAACLIVAVVWMKTQPSLPVSVEEELAQAPARHARDDVSGITGADESGREAELGILESGDRPQPGSLRAPVEESTAKVVEGEEKGVQGDALTKETRTEGPPAEAAWEEHRESKPLSKDGGEKEWVDESAGEAVREELERSVEDRKVVKDALADPRRLENALTWDDPAPVSEVGALEDVSVFGIDARTGFWEGQSSDPLLVLADEVRRKLSAGSDLDVERELEELGYLEERDENALREGRVDELERDQDSAAIALLRDQGVRVIRVKARSEQRALLEEAPWRQLVSAASSRGVEHLGSSRLLAEETGKYQSAPSEKTEAADGGSVRKEAQEKSLPAGARSSAAPGRPESAPPPPELKKAHPDNQETKSAEDKNAATGASGSKSAESAGLESPPKVVALRASPEELEAIVRFWRERGCLVQESDLYAILEGGPAVSPSAPKDRRSRSGDRAGSVDEQPAVDEIILVIEFAPESPKQQ